MENELPSPASDGDIDAKPVVLECEALALHKETARVVKRVRRTVVRASRVTKHRDALIEEDLSHEEVVVERVAIGRVVESVPPVRQEGDVTILSVVVEELVVQRRLILTEEVRMRRVRISQRYTETVSLREQDVTVTRTELEEPVETPTGNTHFSERPTDV